MDIETLDSKRIRSGFNTAVSQLAAETGDSEEDILVNSLGLMIIALRAKRQGQILVITTPSTIPAEAATKITGF